jgi:hypothetical protein
MASLKSLKKVSNPELDPDPLVRVGTVRIHNKMRAIL